MTSEAIIESGMSFGPYADGHCFYIEQSHTLREINKKANKGEGVQIAEFLLLRTKDNQVTVSIVEAKSSSPQRSSQPNFDNYIDEIKAKLINSLALFVAIYLQRHPTGSAELPDHFRQLTLASVHFQLILVIKNSKTEWLPPLQDGLKKALKPTVKIWNLAPTSISVLNEEEARKRALVN
jgi:hypothetical protein